MTARPGASISTARWSRSCSSGASRRGSTAFSTRRSAGAQLDGRLGSQTQGFFGGTLDETANLERRSLGGAHPDREGSGNPERERPARTLGLQRLLRWGARLVRQRSTRHVVRGELHVRRRCAVRFYAQHRACCHGRCGSGGRAARQCGAHRHCHRRQRPRRRAYDDLEQGERTGNRDVRQRIGSEHDGQLLGGGDVCPPSDGE